MKMKNSSHRHDINRPTPGYGQKYREHLRMMMLICIKQHMKQISNTEAGLKKALLRKKACNQAFSLQSVIMSLSYKQ